MQEKINKKNMTIILALILITIASTAIIFATFTGKPDLLFQSKKKNIAEKTEINTQWKEIAINPPLKATRQSQNILIQIPEINDWNYTDDKTKPQLITKDGTLIDIDVILIDQNEEEIVLQPVSIGSSIGFAMSKKDGGAFFDKNKEFKTLRLRSTHPITAQNIIWYNWTGK
ncbi:MAG: hypothetical protein KC736_04745 [Candidatus Moranbacteria bacterium]|nr:hypothetical protein [Candidatus Moranbacteria bacterium]